MQDVTTRLVSVDRFVEAAAIVCEEARRLGASHTIVRLHRESGASVLAIESDASEATFGCTVTTPLVGVDGPCGAIVHHRAESFAAHAERELLLLAMHFSVWCTRHGVGAVPDAPATATRTLGPRQRGIAQLAARGLSNAAIGQELGISINTVKARLKEVFARLHVASRGELSRLMARLAPLTEIQPGVTRLANVTVTVVRA